MKGGVQSREAVKGEKILCNSQHPKPQTQLGFNDNDADRRDGAPFAISGLSLSISLSLESREIDKLSQAAAVSVSASASKELTTTTAAEEAAVAAAVERAANESIS